MKITGLHKHPWLLIAMKETQRDDYIKTLNSHIAEDITNGVKW